MTDTRSKHPRHQRRRMAPVLVLVLAALLAWSDVSQAESLVNGSFETGDISGWADSAPPGSSMEIVDSWMEDQYVMVYLPESMAMSSWSCNLENRLPIPPFPRYSPCRPDRR